LNILAFIPPQREKELLNVNQRAVDLQEETFLLNTKIYIDAAASEIAKYLKLIAGQNREIHHTSRARVKLPAASKLEYGTILPMIFLNLIKCSSQARQILAFTSNSGFF